MTDIAEDEAELTDEALRQLETAREEMARGEYITHKEIMAKYG